jgi:diguanylate cyclase (GGDEF)-like protein
MSASLHEAARPAHDAATVGGGPDADERVGFGPEFETAYTRARLSSQRTLIRVACTFGALLAMLRGVEQMFVETWHPAQPIALTLVAAASVLLAVVAFAPSFERLYLPTARIVVPARNAIAAIFVTGAATQGHPEMLMFLPLMVVGPYFFLGLSGRTALVAALLGFGGFLAAAGHFGLAPVTALHVSALLSVATLATAIAARNLDRLARRSFLETHRISELAENDPLTGLKNRRVFDDRLHAIWQETIEHQGSLAILLIDIDYFKAFNDRRGHLAGDQALREAAQTLQSFVTRPGDVLSRYGGEEFAAIIRDIDVRAAEALAENMRRAVGDLDVRQRGARDAAPISVSIGVAVVAPAFGREPRGAVQLADQALYEAKRRGRNRVALKDQSAYQLLETGVFAEVSFVREA